MTAEQVAAAYAVPSRWAKLPKDGLRIHEIEGSHAIDRHVGKTDTQLRNRLRSQPRIPGASSYASRYDAERFTDQILVLKEAEIKAWVASGSPRPRFFDVDMRQVVGRGIGRKETAVHDMSVVRVVLVTDGRFPLGYRVLTSMPSNG